jgi:Flp pilus assembly pilin Flp
VDVVVHRSPFDSGQSSRPGESSCVPQSGGVGDEEVRVEKLWERFRREDGMTTAEYAVGLIAAVAFAGILYKVVTSGAVLAALTSIVKRALAQ